MRPSDWLEEAKLYSDEFIAVRRDLHRHPELGRSERRTAALITEKLTQMGIEAVSMADTGIMGILKGAHSGKTIALRADIDALPIRETTSLPYASENDGLMHACGHDIHTAALLGAAKLMSLHRGELCGEIRFFLPPAEEGDGGARRMIDEGCMNGVEAVFGAHVSPELKAGCVGIRYGHAYAASNPFDITLRGRSAHGAEPQNGRDTIVAASEIVLALQTLVSRCIAPTDTAVVSIGSFHAGTTRNIIADEARLSGMLRCYGAEMRRKLSDALTRTVKGIAAAHGVEAEIAIQWGYDGIINDESMTRRVEAAAEALLGRDHLVVEALPSLTTEDFGAYLQHAPGSYWHIGVADESGCCAPLHNSGFAPSEDAIAVAMAIHAAICFDALNG